MFLMHLPLAAQLAIVGVVLILAVFVAFTVKLMRRDAAARHEIMKGTTRPYRRKEPRAGDNPATQTRAWSQSEEAERDHQMTKRPEIKESELPAINMVDTHWATGEQAAVPRQSAMVAGVKPKAAATESIYKSGYNPFFQTSDAETKVEEIVDLVEQAELMLTLKNYDEAIAALTRHIRETEKPAPNAWLMLFDVFAKTGRREQYNNLAKGFRMLFNAQVPSWEKQATESSKHLDDYGRVFENVQRLWGMPTCRSFLESLLYDDRGGNRQGFMLAAYSDILFLLELIDVANLMAGEEEERRRIELKLTSAPLM